MTDLPGHERRHERRLERHLDDDEPGAPPGFLIDDDDDKTHELVGEVPRDRWDPDDTDNRLARGHGEEED
jgi:hypothetical protein